MFLFNDALNTFYLWLCGIDVVMDHSAREETRCCQMGSSFRLAARVLLSAPFHRQDSTYNGLCYTSHGALTVMRNSSVGPPCEMDPMTYRTMIECSITEIHLPRA